MIDLNNPFVKALLPFIGIVAIVLLCKYKYHYSVASNLKLCEPPLQQLLFWLMMDMIWMLGTDYLLNWRGPWNLAPWMAQPLYVSILRVLAVCLFGLVSAAFLNPPGKIPLGNLIRII